MARSTEMESRYCKYDQRDSDGDGGGGDEGGGPLHPLDAMAKLQQYASCEMPYNRNKFIGIEGREFCDDEEE
ncbi:hypothetical protein PV325_007738 [Microctonus aethiopoides]|nr:hypothetical protein PV325_007738 [Microctonus aethiopoides]